MFVDIVWLFLGPMLQKILRLQLTNFLEKLVFAPGKPFQPSMFVGKAEAYQNETSFKCSTLG
jgi:hypothetical protein